MSQSKHWCYTLNNYNDEDVKRLRILAESDECEYMVFGKEVGESGTPHLQGYLILAVKKRMVQVKKMIGSNAHLEKKRGSADQAAEYCKKDGDFEEYGECRGQGRRTDLDKVVSMVKEGKSMQEISEENPVEVIKYGRGIAQLKLFLEPSYSHETVRGVWIYGPPGVGKSHAAREYDANAYVKPQNKWWDGYQGEKTVILDDLDTNVLGHYLKIWADKYACTGETKGGTCNLRHTKFIVTSNYSPEELWSEDEIMCEAIRRRFIVNHKEFREGITRFD